jgi:hypothetical protein
LSYEQRHRRAPVFFHAENRGVGGRASGRSRRPAGGGAGGEWQQCGHPRPRAHLSGGAARPGAAHSGMTTRTRAPWRLLQVAAALPVAGRLVGDGGAAGEYQGVCAHPRAATAQPEVARGALTACDRDTGGADGMTAVLRHARRPGKGRSRGRGRRGGYNGEPWAGWNTRRRATATVAEELCSDDRQWRQRRRLCPHVCVLRAGARQ